MAACDLLVFPATTNHFARPIVEAGAMGKPVVASRFPIIEELVKNGETGFSFRPENPALLLKQSLPCFGIRKRERASVSGSCDR